MFRKAAQNPTESARHPTKFAVEPCDGSMGVNTVSVSVRRTTSGPAVAGLALAAVGLPARRQAPPPAPRRTP